MIRLHSYSQCDSMLCPACKYVRRERERRRGEQTGRQVMMRDKRDDDKKEKDENRDKKEKDTN